MNCNIHKRNQISLICIAPHKCQCQRKLCAECFDEHGVDSKHMLKLNTFQDMVTKKLQEQQFYQISELTTLRMNFKSLISQTENMLKKTWEDLSLQIKYIYDMIEMENISYLNILNDLAVSPHTDLEKLIQVVDGKTLNQQNDQNQNDQKDSYLIELEKLKNWWDKEIKAISQMLKKEMKELASLIKIQSISQEDQAYELKEDLYEVLASLKDVDVKVFSFIMEILRKEEISDCIGFLQKLDTQKHCEEYINKQQKINDVKKNIKDIVNVIKNIYEHDFNKNDYSNQTNKKTRKNLIEKIQENQKIIEFLKFLVSLTTIDSKFIQSGSNSLNLLVEMKVDLTKHCFENIKIQNTSLIGANLVRCNLNGSQFDNVDISGMNLNGAQLFNCKWKDLKIHEQNELDGHTSYVRSVCFSPDCTLLASGSNDDSIRLWDVKTGQQKIVFEGHCSGVNSVFFSPDGTQLASGSNDKSIRLWDVKTGRQIQKLEGHTNLVLSACFSPDSTTLASGGYDNSICLWDVQTGQQKSRLDGHSNCIYSLCFSPDGTILASGSADKSIYLWDVKTGQQKSKLDGHSNCINSVCFSPDGTTLASGSDDNSICLWDVKTEQQQSKLDGHTNFVLSVCFSPDGTILASGSYDNSIRLWDVQTGQQKSRLDGHTSIVYSVCFSPDGTTLASGSDDNSIRLWDVGIEKQQQKLDGHSSNIGSVCFSPDGTILAFRSYDSSICVWDVKTGKEVQPSDKSYEDILTQFKTPLQNNSSSEVVNTNITILLVSQYAIFQVQGALIFKGEFRNDQGVDLRQFFKSKGSFFLDSEIEFQQKQN